MILDCLCPLKLLCMTCPPLVRVTTKARWASGSCCRLTAKMLQVRFLAWDLSVRSLHVCVGSIHVLRLPPVCQLVRRSIEHSELSVGVRESVNDCLPLCGPVMNWRLAQGATRLCTMTAGRGSRQTPVTLDSRKYVGMENECMYDLSWE